MIDWYLLVQKYNDKHGADYESERSLLIDLYEKYRSTNKLGDILLVSHTTIQKKLKEYGVKIQPRGYPHLTPVQNKILKYRKDKFKNMTAKEAAGLIGCHVNHARNIFNKFGYRYKKGPVYKKDR